MTIRLIWIKSFRYKLFAIREKYECSIYIDDVANTITKKTNKNLLSHIFIFEVP